MDCVLFCVGGWIKLTGWMLMKMLEFNFLIPFLVIEVVVKFIHAGHVDSDPLHQRLPLAHRLDW